MKNMISIFGYPIKRLTANRWTSRSCKLISHALLLFACSCLFATTSFADKSQQDKHAIEKSRKHFQSLSPAEREKVKNRYEWYKDLPPEKQKEIRERWKKSGH